MSEDSSPTSSQLDDIEFTQPARRIFETDVGTLFERTRQQCEPEWDLPAPRRGLPVFEPPAHPGPKSDSHQTSSISLKTHLCNPGDVTSREDASSACKDVTSPGQLQLSTPRHDFSNDTSQMRSEFSRSTCTESQQSTERTALSSGRHNRPTSVDLLSTAFVMDQRIWQQGAKLGYTPADIIARRTCKGFGVDPSEVMFYELVPVPVTAVKASGQYAVRINKAGFSLQAMEDLLADNQVLKQTSLKCTSAMESLQELLREFDEDRSRLHLQAGEYQAEVRRLQERCRIAEGHVKLLKQQLCRSDQLRIDGQMQLDNLKQEFLDLTRILPRRPSSGHMPLSARPHHATINPNGPSNAQYKPLSARGPPPSLSSETADNPQATSRGPSSHRGPSGHAGNLDAAKAANADRALSIIEKLSNPQVLAKLDSLLCAATENGRPT